MVSVETLSTPLGRLFIVADGGGLKEVHIKRLPSTDTMRARYGKITEKHIDVVEPVILCLERYFRGERVCFRDIPLNPSGTAFLKKVWAALQDIPYGEVRTYGELARQLETSSRAVGLACRMNPMPIIAACHRVVARDLSLHNYSAGVALKKKLLELEGLGVEDAPDLRGARVRGPGT